MWDAATPRVPVRANTLTASKPHGVGRVRAEEAVLAESATACIAATLNRSREASVGPKCSTVWIPHSERFSTSQR
ncbi:hypothetical protein QF030_000191 [Streptomyces rishiriensis]|uniref:Uncharacterized protein n=1 Tax=Streptomyces rishiriensis TaxID=68264 RepID=A0ABU0NFZ2_STRRH|nr:hypothetical protein [Streptomyces rishiriensis]